jgi:threonine dehydratase
MYENVVEAAKRLEGVAHKTPVMTSQMLDKQTGNTIFLKCENLQRIGAFKFRGAYNAVSSLPQDVRGKGIITYSSGNHAQAVALTGNLLKVHTTVVVPSDTAPVKIAAAKSYGADIVYYDRAKERREDVTQQLIDKNGYIFIPLERTDSPVLLPPQSIPWQPFPVRLLLPHYQNTLARSAIKVLLSWYF